MLFPARRRLQRCSSWRRNFRIVNSTAQSFAFFRVSDEQRCRRSKTQPTRPFRSGNARFNASMDGLQNTPATSNNDVSTGGTDANGKGSSQEHHDSRIARSQCKAALRGIWTHDLYSVCGGTGLLRSSFECQSHNHTGDLARHASGAGCGRPRTRCTLSAWPTAHRLARPTRGTSWTSAERRCAQPSRLDIRTAERGGEAGYISNRYLATRKSSLARARLRFFVGVHYSIDPLRSARRRAARFNYCRLSFKVAAEADAENNSRSAERPPEKDPARSPY